MEWYWIIFCGIPAGIVYTALMLYIASEIQSKFKGSGCKRMHLRQLKKRLNNIKKDDDKYCMKEKILLGIKDYHNYNRSYGRKYYERAEEELWEFLKEYIDKDKLFLEEL